MKSTMFMLAGAVCAYLLLPPPYVSGEPPTPNVNVVNVPGVEVVNETPIAVTAVIDAPVTVTPDVQERFHAASSNHFDADDGAAELSLFTVPEGKRVVVQHVSGRMNGLKRGSVSSCLLWSRQGNQSPRVGPALLLPTVIQPEGTASERHPFSTPVTFVAEAGETLEVVCNFTWPQDGLSGLSAFLNGYTIDVE